MRVLTGPASIRAEIESCPDPSIAHLLAQHLEFMSEYDGDETLTVVLVEPGDTLATVDTELQGQLLRNAYSDKQYGDSGFVPSFETLTEHQSFYEMFFIEGGGEGGTSVLIPRQDGIDPALLEMCAQHSVRDQS